MSAAIRQQDIERGLRELGLRAGDIVLLHSSLASLGHVTGGAAAVVDAFLAVLGEAGTLVVPTFGELGIVPETVGNRREAVKSIHPLASVAAIGRDAVRICQDHWQAELAHGADTPYTRIAELGGYVCLLGVDQDRSTTLHTAEELLWLPYLRTTKETTFDTPAGPVTKAWPAFPGPHRDLIGLDRTFRESGKMTMGRIGDSVIRLIKSTDVIEIARRIGARDPEFVLCDNPNCADCVQQRADVRRDRFGRESFTLVAAASLAGRYAEEIADRCRLAGVDRVELDCLRGQPVNAVPRPRLEKAIGMLRDEGCAVAAVRVPAVPAELDGLLDLVAANGVARVVLPLTGDAAAHVEGARARGVAVSFYNVAMSSPHASAILLGLHENGLAAGFTFDAAAFAAAGEKPFLESYKQKLRRFVDQLVVGDATFDGTPQPLGGGNAEIKEMISILRCASFSGDFVLSSTNRHRHGTLEQTVRRFIELLDRL